MPLILMKNYQLLSCKYCPSAKLLMSLNPSFIFSTPLSRHTSFWSTCSDLPSWWLNLSFVVVVQSPGHVQLFPTPWSIAHQASLSLTISQSLPKFMFIALVMPSSCLIFWHPLLLPSIFPGIRDFSNESFVLIRWPKQWSFCISPSSEYSGFISLKIGWFNLLAVQGTFRSPLQHHSSKASVLWRCAFFMVQLSRLYMTNGKTIALLCETLSAE